LQKLIPEISSQFNYQKFFAFIGQRFTIDGWAMSKVIFEEIIKQGKKDQ